MHPRVLRSACLLTMVMLGLSGCGSDAPDRVGGGAVGGAATGATFGLIGGPVGVIVGGAIGGGIGALTAVNTTPKQVDLGNPPWAGRSGAAPQASAERSAAAPQASAERSAAAPQTPQPLMPASSPPSARNKTYGGSTSDVTSDQGEVTSGTIRNDYAPVTPASNDYAPVTPAPDVPQNLANGSTSVQAEPLPPPQ